MPRPLPTPIRAVLFDLDGTLVDTAPDFVHAMTTLCHEAGRPALSDQDIHATVSNGARALVELAFQFDVQHSEFAARLERLLNLYGQKIENSDSQLYPGMNELLKALEHNGIPWGIVTNKPERYCLPLLKHLGLGKRCATLVCPDHVQQSKPHPEPILLACKTMSVNPLEAVYIGDHERDIQAGQAAELYSIAVEYGYITADCLISQWGADAIARDTAQLMTQLGLRATPTHGKH
jgi:2-phosphoglycolate phosphatase